MCECVCECTRVCLFHTSVGPALPTLDIRIPTAVVSGWTDVGPSSASLSLGIVSRNDFT